MPANPDQGIALQTDTLSPVAGGPVRTLSLMVPVNGVMTQVQAQVVMISDSTGNIIDGWAQYDQWRALLTELREIRTILAIANGMPAIFQPLDIPPAANPGITTNNG